MTEPSRASRAVAETPLLRLSVLLWLLGLPGALAIAWQVGVRLHNEVLPLWVLPLVGGLQSALLVAAAAFFGAWSGPRLGLGAPVLVAVLRRKQVGAALHSTWLPAVGGGIVGAAWMVTLAQLTPYAWGVGDPVQALPIAVKLIYGGLTEELLARWGVMTMVLFALWRMVQPRGGIPRHRLVWIAIAVAALVCAVANLVPAMVLLGSMTPYLLAYVLVGHFVFGLLTGYIYWRHGLEAAMLAHALALGFSHGLT